MEACDGYLTDLDTTRNIPLALVESSVLLHLNHVYTYGLTSFFAGQRHNSPNNNQNALLRLIVTKSTMSSIRTSLWTGSGQKVQTAAERAKKELAESVTSLSKAVHVST